MHGIEWKNLNTVSSKSFDCGYCGHSIASDKAYSGTRSDGRYNHPLYIYICHHCQKPSFIDEHGNQTPKKSAGKKVPNIDSPDIEKLYNEARSSFSAGAYTASAMCCRKLLMNLAVSKGADENSSFNYYVGYLETNNYLPNGTKDWVDAIRTKGNEATHEIALSTESDAEEILDFSEMLLRLIYEFPSRAQKHKNSFH